MTLARQTQEVVDRWNVRAGRMSDTSDIVSPITASNTAMYNNVLLRQRKILELEIFAMEVSLHAN